jgi:branched-chain amino acid transport system permease protein
VLLHVPILIAILMSAVLTGVIGAIIGALTLRLGNVYVAIATLTFGLLFENLVYLRNRFYQFGAGVAISRPSFAQSDVRFTYLTLGIFALLCIFIINLRRSTTGLALGALRSTEVGTVSVGLSVVRIKLLISVVAASIAGIGGGLLACYSGAAVPDSYDTLTGLVWFAIVVTLGIRSSSAALVGGLSLAFIPAIFISYLSTSWAEVPTALFGLGAILAARNPQGIIALHAGQLNSAGSAIRALVHGPGRGAVLRPEVALDPEKS